MGRCAAAHRLATDEQPLTGARQLCARRFDRCTIAGDQLRHTIGNLPPLFCVQEIERQDVEAVFAEARAKHDHERMLLRRAGTMGQDERRRKSGFLLADRVDQRESVAI